MKLSILIPYYNAEKYIKELLDRLKPQIVDGVEVILIDDGSDKAFTSKFKSRPKWLTIIRQENRGGAAAKNTGLDYATGDYVTFIDADDLVPEYFVERLLKEIELTGADVIDYSWKSLTDNGVQFDKKLHSPSERLTNCSVCTRAFKKSYLGNKRFNEKKDATYDEDFSRKVGYLTDNHKHTSIPEYMYFYRTDVEDSSIHKYKEGLKRTKRIVYHYDHVTKDMTWLIDEIKKEDEFNEVWLITNQNDLPELARYCQITKRHGIWGHELRGDALEGFKKITPPIKAEIVHYCEYMNVVGGMSTWLYNFCAAMIDHSMIILYDRLDAKQVKKLESVVKVMKNEGQQIECDTLIVHRLTDKIPPNVKYNKTIQVCHACVQKKLRIPQGRDFLVNVTKAAKDSWGKESEDGIVIHNFVLRDFNELLLVSATRTQAGDKGQNDERFRKLAKMMNDEGIRFTWLNFSDKGIEDPPENLINMPPKLNVQAFMRRADYLVQLSDVESFGFSILEAMINGTPVLTTGFPALYENGFVDGVHGYVLPADMNFDINKILKIPKFNYEYDNLTVKEEWEKLLKTPPKPADTKVEITHDYFDNKMQKMVYKGERYLMKKSRALELVANPHGLIKIL